MKKLILAIFCATSVSVANSFQVPLDRNNQPAQSINDVGVRTFTSTLTNHGAQTPFLITGSTILVHWVITSTAPSAAAIHHAFAELRGATDTANTTSELLVPPIGVTSTTINNIEVFNPPVITHTGLSVFVNTYSARVTIGYTFASTSTDVDFFVPRDDRQVIARDPRFYGVQPSSQIINPGTANDRLGTETLDFTTDEKMTVASSTTFRVKGLLYGQDPSTGATTSFVVYRDTQSTGNTRDQDLAVVPIFYQTIADQLGTARNGRPFAFPTPIRFENGLTAQTSVATERLRVFVRDRRKTR